MDNNTKDALITIAGLFVLGWVFVVGIKYVYKLWNNSNTPEE